MSARKQSARSSRARGLMPLLPESEFQVFARDYELVTSFPLLLIDVEGAVLCGEVSERDCHCGGYDAEVLGKALQEAWRWGEPCINTCCSVGYAVWAVPVMLNERLLGGLIVCGVPLECDEHVEQATRIQDAAWTLFRMACERNFTNVSFLERQREKANRDRMRFESIESVKFTRHDNLRQSYLQEEPALLAAIREGDRRRARHILNTLLVGIYHAADRRIDLLKSYAIELVSMMCRAAVEAGGAPGEILGANYASIAQLDRIHDDEEMANWLADMLENLMDAIRDNTRYPSEVLINKAIQYMREHLHEELHREVVARHAGLSSSHFARLIKDTTGRSFSEMLAQIRVNKASQMLRRSDASLIQIATDCGFFDQSHFSRTFKKLTGQTPGHYRKAPR